ncbi:hypothetical protein BDR06DRAFT_946962 [Suillus hirtellus]|nr:hypothetical protein BDR06DRAFT_946962 [Suillus hirtellus]
MSLSPRLPAIRIITSISSDPCRSLTLTYPSTTSTVIAFFLAACQRHVVVHSFQSTVVMSSLQVTRSMTTS